MPIYTICINCRIATAAKECKLVKMLLLGGDRMKRNFSICKRCLSFLLAFVLMLSCGQHGILLAALATSEGEVTVSDGVLLGKQYTLSANLQALLNSGLLNENFYTYLCDIKMILKRKPINENV